MLELFQLPIWEELAYRLAANIWLLKHLALFLPAPLNVELKGSTIHHLPRGLPLSREEQRSAFNHTGAGAEGNLLEDTVEKYFH